LVLDKSPELPGIIDPDAFCPRNRFHSDKQCVQRKQRLRSQVSPVIFFHLKCCRSANELVDRLTGYLRVGTKPLEGPHDSALLV
jgi:hypothetical protein